LQPPNNRRLALQKQQREEAAAAAAKGVLRKIEDILNPYIPIYLNNLSPSIADSADVLFRSNMAA
jgi:hypothetical protein